MASCTHFEAASPNLLSHSSRMIDVTLKFLPLHCIVDGSSDNELQDAFRLPAGMSRIGDADTERYTFQDEQGVLYESEPGNAYGILRPIVWDVGDVSKVRPNAFESENSLRSRSTSAASSNLHSFDEFLPSAAITSTSSSLPEEGGLSSPNSRITGVVDKVKAAKSVVSRLQTSKSEGGRHRHSKSSSLIPSFRKSQFSSLPSKRGRAYSEIRDQIGTDDGDETMRELHQSNLSSGGLESSPPPSWSSFRPTSSHQSTSASQPVRILSAKTWRRLSSAPITSAVIPSRTT